jgi:cytochrome c-type biogenesis protein CcmH
MMPNMKISAFPEIVIGARVSKSGSATPAPGDLEGASGPVKPGQSDIKVSIDRQAAKP